MGLLKNFIEQYKRKKEKFVDAKENYEVQNKVLERTKNSNERELERYYEEERQRQIERELKLFRKKRMDELYKSNMFNEKMKKEKNIFRGNKLKLCGGRAF